MNRPSSDSHRLTRLEYAAWTLVGSCVALSSAFVTLPRAPSQASHELKSGIQPQCFIRLSPASISESGLGEKYVDDVDGRESLESDRGGLGRSPNVSRLEAKFRSDRHVRSVRFPDIGRAAFDSLAAAVIFSNEGEPGRRS